MLRTSSTEAVWNTETWNVPVASSLKDRTDEEIFLQYREHRDNASFTILYERCRRELFSYLRRYLNNESLADEAASATWLIVSKKCHMFEGTKRFRPWLYTIATNQAIDVQRRERRHRLVSIDKTHASTSSGKVDGDSGSLKDLLQEKNGRTAEEQLTHEEMCASLRRALEKLSDEVRGALLLVYSDGMKYREAAVALNIPIGTVKSRIHSGIRTLEKILAQEHLGVIHD